MKEAERRTFARVSDSPASSDVPSLGGRLLVGLITFAIGLGFAAGGVALFRLNPPAEMSEHGFTLSIRLAGVCALLWAAAFAAIGLRALGIASRRRLVAPVLLMSSGVMIQGVGIANVGYNLIVGTGDRVLGGVIGLLGVGLAGVMVDVVVRRWPKDRPEAHWWARLWGNLTDRSITSD